MHLSGNFSHIAGRKFENWETYEKLIKQDASLGFKKKKNQLLNVEASPVLTALD